MRILMASQNITGTFNQCRGVAERIVQDDRASLRPLGPLSIHRLAHSEALLSRIRWLARRLPPVVLISCGSVGETKARQLVASGRRCLWAHIETPRGEGPQPDLVFVSRHDWLPAFDRRRDHIALDGVPHAIRAADLAVARAPARERLGLAETDRMTAILIGGANPAFAYSEPVRDRILATLEDHARSGRRVFVTGSRRTDPALMQRLVEERKAGLVVYDGRGPNPYRDYLAAADEILVSEDSISMCCEALTTGRPVSLLRLEPRPGARLDKFRRFQAHMIGTLGVLDAAPDREQDDGPVPDDASRAAERILAALRVFLAR